MAFYPIVKNLVGSPVIDPFTNGFFTFAGNQLASFTPGTKFAVFDNASPQSNVYGPFTVSAGSPILTNFNGTNTEVYVDEPITNISPYTYQQAVDGYVLEFSDPTKTPLVIPVLEDDSTTNLVLPGRGTLDYGEKINANLLHLLENFAGPCPPGSTGSPCAYGSPFPDQNAPVEGQLWYDTIENTIKVWNANSMAWEGFAGSGRTDDVLFGSSAFAVNLVTDGITPVNVNVQPRTATKSYQQVFFNGVLQREDDSSFTNSGSYYITAVGGDIVFAFDLDPTDEVLVYAL